MPVRSSSSREVERLVERLAAGLSVDRDAAVARLRVIGSRATARLTGLVADAAAAPAARAAALAALEGSDDPRARSAAVAAVGDAHEPVALAAIAAMRGWIDDIEILDALTAIILDATRSAAVRLAALDVVSQLPPAVVQPLLQQVAIDSGGIPDDPIAAREWLARQVRAPLSTLHDFVVFSRERERQEASARRRADWLVTRGAAHALLARRASRVALYDLREAFDTAETPLPLDFLTAMATLGDADCLESLARAWTAAPGDRWWRTRLAETAAEIARRLGLNGRTAAVKRIRARYRDFL